MPTSIDTIATATQALLEIDETITHVSVDIRDGATERRILVWRCSRCEKVHAEVDERRPWVQDDSTFDHDRPGGV